MTKEQFTDDDGNVHDLDICDDVSMGEKCLSVSTSGCGCCEDYYYINKKSKDCMKIIDYVIQQKKLEIIELVKVREELKNGLESIEP
jgi:hypothetical protein